MKTRAKTEFGEQLIDFIESAIATADDDIDVDTDLLLTGLVDSLGVILIVMGFWRRSPRFLAQAYTANVAMMAAGFVLMGLQITGFILTA